MNELQETLNILLHYDNIISGRTNFCKRNIDFNISDFIQNKLSKIENYNPNIYIKNDPILAKISRECADLKITLHSYLCLNIIDIFSFNDEYNKYFVENRFNDENIKLRIRNVKTKNKNIRKKLDWKKLERFRNQILAHNLRDNENRLSVKVLKEITQFLSNLKSGIEFSEVILEMFDNIKFEFEKEITESQYALIDVIKKLN
jgi:hypothetical protein